MRDNGDTSSTMNGMAERVCECNAKPDGLLLLGLRGIFGTGGEEKHATPFGGVADLSLFGWWSDAQGE